MKFLSLCSEHSYFVFKLKENSYFFFYLINEVSCFLMSLISARITCQKMSEHLCVLSQRWRRWEQNTCPDLQQERSQGNWVPCIRSSWGNGSHPSSPTTTLTRLTDNLGFGGCTIARITTGTDVSELVIHHVWHHGYFRKHCFGTFRNNYIKVGAVCCFRGRSCRQ